MFQVLSVFRYSAEPRIAASQMSLALPAFCKAAVKSDSLVFGRADQKDLERVVNLLACALVALEEGQSDLHA